MQVISDLEALRPARAALAGPVGLVPTMGALHAGHLSLVEAARADCHSVVVTIFINPLQFEAGSDFDKYPRDLPADLALLESAGVDLVFTPTPDIMYPPGFQTTVRVAEVSKGLEGARRPGHFDGVATVLTKLFHLTQPDLAYFGQKDAQQVVVVRRMVRDLNFPLEIVVCPTTREADGLAMSSRNRYLSPEERQHAASIYQALQAAAALYEDGERDADALRGQVADLLSHVPGGELEYVSLADPGTLVECAGPVSGPALLSLVLRLGETRLLDNLLLPVCLNTREGLTATLGA
ncbi:MAG: pantoate--beta-alanine ligase [Chloroflexota bacterium]